MNENYCLMRLDSFLIRFNMAMNGVWITRIGYFHNDYWSGSNRHLFWRDIFWLKIFPPLHSWLIGTNSKLPVIPIKSYHNHYSAFIFIDVGMLKGRRGDKNIWINNKREIFLMLEILLNLKAVSLATAGSLLIEICLSGQVNEGHSSQHRSTSLYLSLNGSIVITWKVYLYPELLTFGSSAFNHSKITCEP